MNLFKITGMAFAAVMLAACGGANGKASASPGDVDMSAQWGESRQVEGSSEAAQMPPTATNPAQDQGDEAPPEEPEQYAGLPAECHGKLPQPEEHLRLASSVVCRCANRYWSTSLRDPGFPNCKVPDPSEVYTAKVTERRFARADDPYKPEVTEQSAKTEERVRVTTERTGTRGTSGKQVSCTSRLSATGKLVSCMVKDGNAPAREYTCIGQGVQEMTPEERSAYTGGAPCTCASGTPQDMSSAQTPNTWRCRE